MSKSIINKIANSNKQILEHTIHATIIITIARIEKPHEKLSSKRIKQNLFRSLSHIKILRRLQ